MATESDLRWIVGIEAHPLLVETKNKDGELIDRPVALLAVACLEKGKSLREAIFTALPDEQYAFILSIQSVQDLIDDLTKLLPPTSA